MSDTQNIEEAGVVFPDKPIFELLAFIVNAGVIVPPAFTLNCISPKT
mgnify:CR=1 FL=1